MTAKTKKDLENELQLMNALETERKLNKILFAEKRVEALLYGLIGIILVAFIGAVINLVITK